MGRATGDRQGGGEVMTPERRAEIESQLSWWKGKYGSGRYADRVMEVDGVNHLSDLGEFSEFGAELLAEIDRLTKVVDQAIGVSRMTVFDGMVLVEQSFPRTHAHTVPELADHLRELERRSKMSNEKCDTMDKS